MSIANEMQKISRAILFAQELHGDGLSVLQMIVLFSLPENSPVLYGEMLKRYSAWPDSSLHRHCKKLVLDGLMAYTRDGYDTRCATYHLTKKGRDLRARIAHAAGIECENTTS